ncbi:SulP family inorganic anion transporter [Demequina aurantiaca]|uniref:SulP family inorganic anion transporter n=1 Tax=Demequina aurantiaca TaxID=676200 RepID=UPI000AC3F20C|nr:SulP family inorganic anion transporter [Demequina aurantiaca]
MTENPSEGVSPSAASAGKSSETGRKKRGKLGRPTPKDAISGLVTGLFSIPEGMAYATIGGFSAPMGLWSGIVPTILGSMFARTVLMITTLTSAIALSAKSVLTDAGLDPGDIGAVAMLTIMVGLAMLALGLLKLGSVMSFVSTAVMTGFTAGIAVQIVAGVMKDATGYDSDSSNTVGKLIDSAIHIASWDPWSVAVAIGTVAVWAVVRLIPRLTSLATLIALLVVTVIVAIAKIDVELVSDIADVPRSLPPLTLPDLSAIPSLAVGAVAIALVALAQAAGIGASVPNPDGSRSDASKDFTAQGLANIGGGFFAALPTGGSLSRTGIATSSGAMTRWAGIFAGLWLLIIVVTIGPLAGLIPMPVIGGLLLVIGGELVVGRIPDMKLVWRTSALSAFAMVLTFVATTGLPLQVAIFFGAGVSIVLYAAQASKQGRIVRLIRSDTGDWSVAELPTSFPENQTTVLHYAGSGFFAEVNRLESEWPEATSGHHAAIVLSLREGAGIPSATFLKSLDAKLEKWHQDGIEVVLCGVSDTLRDHLAKDGTVKRLSDAIIPQTPSIIGNLDAAYELAEQRRTENSAP